MYRVGGTVVEKGECQDQRLYTRLLASFFPEEQTQEPEPGIWMPPLARVSPFPRQTATPSPSCPGRPPDLSGSIPPRFPRRATREGLRPLEVTNR